MEEILGLFGICGIKDVSEISTGHINKTYMADTENGKFIVQLVNDSVFSNPENLMKNIQTIENLFENSDDVRVPHFLKAGEENHVFYKGAVWRVYPYISEEFSGISKNYRTGFAFGRFLKIINSKKIRLEKTIDNYHDFDFYFSRLNSAMANAPLKKIDGSIISRLKNMKNTVSNVFTVDFPKRNIHGDAKAENVIVSDVCTVIDLDTVMKGYSATDYGDMVRSVCGEKPDISVLRDVTRGFAKGLDGMLTGDEVKSLYYGVLWSVSELAVRYFTDYLTNERYFGKTPAECLKRANELLLQLNFFINSGDEIESIIYNAMRNS